MPEKFSLTMRDPRKAPYDVPLLAKYEGGHYVVAKRDDRVGWLLLGEDGLIEVTETGFRGLPAPLFYCELPK